MASCKGSTLATGALRVHKTCKSSGRIATSNKSDALCTRLLPNLKNHTLYRSGLRCTPLETIARQSHMTRLRCDTTSCCEGTRVGGEQSISCFQEAQAKEDCKGTVERRERNVGARYRKILCLSNGHGEDAIAVAILEELKTLAEENGELLSIEALPLVGLGGAYVRAGIRTIGPAQMMPSGGFLYMDRKQIVGDLQAGLMALTWEQLTTLVKWTQSLTSNNATGALLAVGDVLPLAMAWVASKYEKKSRRNGKQIKGQRKFEGGETKSKEMDGSDIGRERGIGRRRDSPVGYGFVGTAKSEFYVREMDGRKLVPEKRDAAEKLLSSDCVHLPWERALMSADECAFTAPRDTLTGTVLRAHLPPGVNSRVLDLGNPMMDGLEPTGCLDGVLGGFGGFRKVAVLPGSRPPEVHRNFKLLLQAADSTASASPGDNFLFISPVVPSLELQPFLDALACAGWRQEEPLNVSERGTLNEAPEQSLERLNEKQTASSTAVQNGALAFRGQSSLDRGLGTSTSKRESSGNAVRQGEASSTKALEKVAPSSTSTVMNEIDSVSFDSPRAGSSREETHQRDANLERTPPKGWPELAEGSVSNLQFRKGRAKMLLVRRAFADCAHHAEAGLAMAGTATEQLVGLGKPVFTVPGGGPQFTFAFAEAQARLLGPSVQLCQSASEVGSVFKKVFSNREQLAAIRENGRRRMGEAGASRRLAEVIWEQLLQ